MNKDILKLAEKQDFDTTKAWGFGGSAGSRYFFPNGAVLVIGKAYFRHRKSEKFSRLYDVKGQEVFDVQSMRPYHWELVAKVVNQPKG